MVFEGTGFGWVLWEQDNECRREVLRSDKGMKLETKKVSLSLPESDLSVAISDLGIHECSIM